MNIQSFPAIIFDLGGVIINLDFQATVRAFSVLGGRYDFAELYSKHKQHPIFDALEKGEASPQEFRQVLRESFGLHAPDRVLDDAWNAMLLDIPLARIRLLQKVGAARRIFLLSNTNQIHKEAFDVEVRRVCGMPTLDPLFEKAYYSHLVGDRKPNASIFERVLHENGLNASETLFIDDSIQHIESAKQLGIATLHLTPGALLELDWSFV